MRNKKVWFITGAGRGMGVDFAKAALGAGHAVVATGRDADRLSRVLGRPSDDLLTGAADDRRAAAASQRFIAGADAIATAAQVVATMQKQIEAYRAPSSSLGFDDTSAAGRGRQ